MSHTEAKVNGITVQMWDNARDRMGVQSATRQFASKLPRGGEIDDSGVINEIDGPSYPGGEIHVWLKGQVLNWNAPDGYKITGVSGFESKHTCVTVEPE